MREVERLEELGGSNDGIACRLPDDLQNDLPRFF
jgi:hypothetical protein